MNLEELARDVERSEMASTRALVEHARSHFPFLRAESLDIAGGYAAFAGVDGPLSEAGGVGIFKPIDDDTVERLTRFYVDCGATPRVMVGPMTDPSFAPALARFGYVPAEYQNVLVADLDAVRNEMDPRVRVTTDASSWARTSMRGFEISRPPEVLTQTLELLASTPKVVALEIVENAKPVATGGIALTSEIPVLFGASTLPAWRKRGWQTALIGDRLARAKKHGATHARASTRPLSASERNFIRCGFSVLYTRTLWERPPGA